MIGQLEQALADNARLLADNARLRAEIARLRAENTRLSAENARLHMNSGRPRSPEPRSEPVLSTEPVPASETTLGPTHPIINNASPVQAKVVLFRHLFRGRDDVYAVRWEDRRGKVGYSPACFALPISWRGTLQQYAGRLHRVHGSKQMVQIYDYVDAQVPVLMRMYERRLKGYRAMGYHLEL